MFFLQIIVYIENSIQYAVKFLVKVDLGSKICLFRKICACIQHYYFIMNENNEPKKHIFASKYGLIQENIRYDKCKKLWNFVEQKTVMVFFGDITRTSVIKEGHQLEKAQNLKKIIQVMYEWRQSKFINFRFYLGY